MNRVELLCSLDVTQMYCFFSTAAIAGVIGIGISLILMVWEAKKNENKH